VIRVLLVDDHPAVRQGLLGIFRSEPGFSVVAACATASEAIEEAERWDADIALVDYELPDDDGLSLAHRLRQLPSAPRVVIYSAFAAPRLGVAAALAGAHGLVDKADPIDTIFATMREVAKGRLCLDQITPEVLRASASQLRPDDQALVGLALAGEPLSEIAGVLGRDVADVTLRCQELIEELRPLSLRARDRAGAT